MEYGVRSFVPESRPTKEAVNIVRQVLKNVHNILLGTDGTFQIVVDRAESDEKYDCLFSLNVKSYISCGKAYMDSDGLLFAGYYSHGNKTTFYVNKDAAKRLFELYETTKTVGALDGNSMTEEEIIYSFFDGEKALD